MKMEIKTKFNVNDLLRRKYDTDDFDTIRALEVMEIHTQTCYNGTQVFYNVRPVVAVKKSIGYGIDKKEKWFIGHGINKEDNSTGWKKYREDELINAPKEIIDIIKSPQEQ